MLLAPHNLHFLWLALVPLVLWLFRRRAKRMQVSTLLFFRSLAREHSESAWLRQLKKWLSFLLTVLIIACAAMALARPSREAAANSPGSVIVMIDCSASMAASDGKASRLDEARRQAKQRVINLPDNVIVSLVAFDDKPTVLLSRSRNRREFVRLLDSITATPTQGDAAAALAVAQRLAALEKPSQIWHLGDARIADAQQSSGYTFTDVALRSVQNVGITGFQLRKAPLARERYDGFVKVSAATANESTVAATLEARIGGRIAQLRELELKPGESTSLILPLEGLHGQQLELELKCPGDCLGWDNAIIAPLPDLKPLIVAWIADKPDPFTELALGSLIEAGQLEILKGSPANWPMKDKPDVYVFERWLPSELPTNAPIIALMPEQSSGPLQVRALNKAVPADSIRNVSATHPVVYRVDASRLSLTQTCLLDTTTSLESLWMAGAEPVLAAGELNSKRVVVTAFSPSKSEQLALLPSYPLLLGNAIYWCAENSDTLSELKPHHTGDVITSTSDVQWQTWNGSTITTAADAPQNSLVPLRRIGSWSTSDGGRSGACVLASAEETNVPKLDAPSTSARDTTPRFARSLSLPQCLIAVVLLLLIAESFLFHRKAVY